MLLYEPHHNGARRNNVGPGSMPGLNPPPRPRRGPNRLPARWRRWAIMLLFMAAPLVLFLLGYYGGSFVADLISPWFK